MSSRRCCGRGGVRRGSRPGTTSSARDLRIGCDLGRRAMSASWLPTPSRRRRSRRRSAATTFAGHGRGAGGRKKQRFDPPRSPMPVACRKRLLVTRSVASLLRCSPRRECPQATTLEVGGLVDRTPRGMRSVRCDLTRGSPTSHQCAVLKPELRRGSCVTFR